ncbi:D-galactose-binding periplasmic protein precursor [Clostridium puniceum]|uniref:D-galactose/methyl-galactoside binding periplasmic protein MglB n=1 Tax=Clostridium puniceum TaxID=29367 RepID=A0A1S8TNT8_9CLOT|nr:galactose ABC transporter substrate-binding protein [Clostridium puniceum]OOM79284.1 D-galactose-binding periplasmic protein precursor [Clostridium puniceum]
MKMLKKILSFAFIAILLLQSIENNAYAILDSSPQNPINVAVFLNDFNDQFISSVKKSLEDIQKENDNRVQFTFFDAKGNQVSQNESIDQSLNKNFDLFVLNLVSTDIDKTKDILTKIMQKNIPLILYYAQTTPIVNFIKPYGNAVIIDTDIDQSGILQGKILSDEWNSNKEALDKNKDNIMQFLMLKGPVNSPETISRTKNSLQTINESGINTQQLSSINCNWDEECAKTAVESNLLTLGDRIEVIISNNDAMAIGAIKALQKYGYNKSINSKNIPVVGVDGLPEAQKLIKQGIMTGTAIQDPREHANAIYMVGMNIVSGKNSLEGTNYKFDETGITIKLPYYEYVAE